MAKVYAAERMTIMMGDSSSLRSTTFYYGL